MYRGGLAMGNYENIVKIEEMRKRMHEGEYTAALKILDTLDNKKIKNISDMKLIAEVYTLNKKYDEAFRLQTRIYDKSRLRKDLYQLVWLSIKRNNATDAEAYYEAYVKAAPSDIYRYVLRYQIDKLLGKPLDILISSLEALKKNDYIEKWAYELAKLYYKAGMEEECIRECSDIILWFADGKYVEKARMLRAYYSGEADKDMIINALKRRASEGLTGEFEPIYNNKSNNNEYEQADTYMQGEYEQSDTYTQGEYEQADYYAQEEYEQADYYAQEDYGQAQDLHNNELFSEDDNIYNVDIPKDDGLYMEENIKADVKNIMAEGMTEEELEYYRNN